MREADFNDLINRQEGLVLAIRSKYDGVNGRLDEVDRELAQLKTGRLRESFNQAVEQATPEVIKAWREYLRKGGLNNKSLVLGDGPQSGFVAPSAFSQNLLETITEFSPIRQAGAGVLTTDKESLSIAKKSSVGVARWVGEIDLRTETTNPIIGLEKITPHEQYRLILVSNQMLEDSFLPFEQMLVKDAAQSFAVLEGTSFISGTGVGECEGLLTNADITMIGSVQ